MAETYGTMRILMRVGVVCVGMCAVVAGAQRPAAIAALVMVEAPVVVLEHVRVIDGTGAAPMEDDAWW